MTQKEFVELRRLRKLERSVKRENVGALRSRGCILCGAHWKRDHKCGLEVE